MSRLHEHLTKRLKQPHRPVRAGLGGTGSMGILFLSSDLLLRHEPRLCFIECTTGDLGTSPPLHRIGPVVEGLIRRLHAIGCSSCLLHLFNRNFGYEDNPVIAQYERVAAHYGIPSIHVGRAFEREIAAGRLRPDDILLDDVHLTPAGSQLAADLIADATTCLFAEPVGKTSLPLPPLHPDGYETAELVPVRSDMLASPNACQFKRYRLAYPYVEIGADNEITFHLSDCLIDGLLFVAGPHCGWVEVRAGSRTVQHLLRDRWCNRERLNLVSFEPPISGCRSIRIRPLDQAPPPIPGLDWDASRHAFKAIAFCVHRRAGLPAAASATGTPP